MRRVLPLVVALSVAVGAGFGLGYVFGHRARERVGATARPASPHRVFVPDALGRPTEAAMQMFEGLGLQVLVERKRTGAAPPGIIFGQDPSPGSEVDVGTAITLIEARGLYPRGYFTWCPDLRGTLPVGSDVAGGARRAALRFSRAFLRGDWKTVRLLLDTSATPLGKTSWSVAGTPNGIRALGDAGTGEPLVTHDCGPKVASRTWGVVIDDGTTSASLDFTLYLVRRADGWKVWASY